ncbi:lysoplasmalogenase [Flammeovirga kamogawensis]|uniref:Lysoplasmalogenase n=1 Tax=Flammeovirga kamogawensis TaxID=373891 RepID=A0ABX8GWG2_9BACT|nr:lysoplasmalogenase [Flammeovirga kamogawensis]MBB6461540.1 putative membrane protein YhhN [Flammeovirga kamogawensis]QWG07527.1 lysoplasmalogenase [Flammeovirga kamogawensis]TRX69341.1 lysoplasmalogenase [Flammeovirga kamogawensis]
MTVENKAVKEPLNNSQKKVFWSIFLVVITVNLLGNYFEDYYVVLYSKPLIMPFISIYFSTTWQQKSENSIIYKCMMIGFFFAWLGDLYMMFLNDELIMLLGLACFLVCHQMYITALFFSSVKDNYKLTLFITFPLSIIGGYIGYLVAVKSSVMFAPILVYSVILVTMFSFALIRWINRRDRWGFMTMIGALLFICSDLMIGLKNFQGLDISEVFIMATYIIAQFCISRGMLCEGADKV